MAVALIIALASLVVGCSLWLGWQAGVRHERQRLSDIIERVSAEPTSRTPGQPTNRSEPGAKVRDPKRRPGRFMS